MKVKSESEVAQSCLTLSDPMDCSLPGSSVHGIFPWTYWSGVYWSGGVLEWGAIAFSEQGLAPSHSRVGPGSIHQPYSASCSLD